MRLKFEVYLIIGSTGVAQSNNNDFVSDEIKKLNELLHDLTLEEDDIKGELEWLKSQDKQSKSQVDDWFNKLQELKKMVEDCLNRVKDALVLGAHNLYEDYPHFLRLEIQQLTAQVSEHIKNGKPLVLSNEFVGEDFERNVKRMWKLVENDQVFMIGIHGMGGVGKTCLATHMETQIKRKGRFKHVIWVMVSREYSIPKLQQDIAESIGVKLGGDERTRAAHLSSALSEKGKWLLILDDVWKFIDLQKVGIPHSRINGSKSILTSRLKHVYRQMDCALLMFKSSLNVKVWSYFFLRLGEYKTPATIPPNILKIAESIAGRCDGLPLAISVMARTMKGIHDIHQWRHALNKLGRLEMGTEMEEEVFKILKLSYDNLMDSCLHCASYSEINRHNMIMKLLERGAINGRRILREIYDEGHTILNELQDHSLLSENRRYLRMQNSVRNMACHILKESQRCMVRCDQRLRAIPHVQEWTADLELVSLNRNLVREIPAVISPFHLDSQK
ncbi:hypothetical protein PIB30_075761 [Stylosanthes scabra]|uniref:NB-ARC domain-containing protein n=1 Tax=Stylosanthes scabra TaxID=79078 RepID=A0ABU6RPX9_9FABA|nr:hypothetical protein [Stylosanthes scabra]